MTLTRRYLVQAALLGAGGLATPVRGFAAADTLDIEMRGSAQGAAVWFDPVGLVIAPGQIIRWVNADRGNSHTATAYHPVNDDRARRIPAGAEPWDSGYLLPGETFSITLGKVGIYDYFCIPHEMAGMVGRIIVGQPGDDSDVYGMGGVSERALSAFPSVEDIMRRGAVPAPR